MVIFVWLIPILLKKKVIIFVYFINTSNNFYLACCSMMENLWKFITWMTPKTRTEFHINLCDHRRDNVSAQQAKLNRLRNTKQHIFAVWRKERERGVGWSMANRYKACVCLFLLSPSSRHSFCLFILFDGYMVIFIINISRVFILF